MASWDKDKDLEDPDDYEIPKWVKDNCGPGPWPTKEQEAASQAYTKRTGRPFDPTEIDPPGREASREDDKPVKPEEPEEKPPPKKAKQ
jgi:hypothetical protein